MKISKIVIQYFHQFQNAELEIDLTYPAGHPKAGQALDKVCFIGQGGTGKTSILELIAKMVFDHNTNIIEYSEPGELVDTVELEVRMGENEEFATTLSFKEIDGRLIWYWSSKEAHDYYRREFIVNNAARLIYLPANFPYDYTTKQRYDFRFEKIIDFSKLNLGVIWQKVANDLSAELLAMERALREVKKGPQEKRKEILDYWNSHNALIREGSKGLDELLGCFNLRIKKELSAESLGFLRLEDINTGQEIPFEGWSTGTKQIVFTGLPLQVLSTNDTIVLFDEPERSLYPDLQRKLIGFYTSMAKKAQCFFATHSPIIASAFDPWEIVTLKALPSGGIIRVPAYDGPRHVKNYVNDPRSMLWQNILVDIFGVMAHGGDEFTRKTQQLAEYYTRLRKLPRTDSTKQQRDELEQEIFKIREGIKIWSDLKVVK